MMRDNYEKYDRSDEAVKKVVEGMLRTCLSAVDSEKTAAFVESLDKFWNTRGYLTPKQYSCLVDIHDRL